MKYLKIALVLCIISLICAAGIAGVNELTASTIEDNGKKAQIEAYQAIFADYSEENSIDVETDNSSIDSIIKAYDNEGNELGLLYTVSGSNSYGKLKIVVAIVDNKVKQIEILENGQSYASTVVSHVRNQYPASPDDANHFGFAPTTPDKVSDLTINDVLNVDTKCGATFGANTVKQLVLIALEDAMGVA